MPALVSSQRNGFRPPSMSILKVSGYELKRKIAEGGCAEVHEGKQTLGSLKVAIKILHPRHLDNKTEYKRLIDEGAIGKRLSVHPHVVKTIDSGMSGKLPYIVLELLPGGTLRALLRARKRIENRELIEISRALSGAMRFLHNSKIYHRDLKPENIMLDGNGMIKIIDLGFAQSHMSARFSLFNRHLDGSPAYMAPEYIRGKKATPGTDVYALGCTLYEAAAGAPPMKGRSDKEVLSRQMNLGLKAEPLRKVCPDIHPHTEKLIMSAVEKDPDKRFKSFDEFLLELSRSPLWNNPPRGIAVPHDWVEGN